MCTGRPQRAEILVVAGYSMKTAGLTGPPRPSVYCLRKCFGGQKPGAALKDVVSNRLRHIWVEGGRRRFEKDREREREYVCEARRKTFRGFWGVGGVSGQEGIWEPWPENGSKPTPS